MGESGLHSRDVSIDSELIHETLSKILDSTPFRSSKQCQDLLRYVVEHSLRQDNEALKERVIGCEVFGRRHDYDTADDPVVRIRAGEVRKRLALYYRAIPHNSQIEMDIPHGSYRVEFRPLLEAHQGQDEKYSSRAFDGSPTQKTTSTPEQITVTPPPDPGSLVSSIIDGVALDSPPIKSKKSTWVLRHPVPSLAVLMAVTALLIFGIWLTRPSTTEFEDFWNPILISSKSPIIYIGSSAVYRTTDDFSAHYGAQHELNSLQGEGREFVARFEPGEKIDADKLIPDQTHFVTIGDTAATSYIVSMLSRLKKPYDLRFSDDIVFSDLRRSPAILIGAFNNTWTIQMDNKFPLVFRPGKFIQEVTPPRRSWETVRDNNGTATEDYALISRQLYSKSGEAAITVAGIDMTGTRAASEFVCDPARMNQALRQLPAGWQDKNMQLLLHANVINGLSSATDVVAYRVW
jgi:hypothetical protein